MVYNATVSENGLLAHTAREGIMPIRNCLSTVRYTVCGPIALAIALGSSQIGWAEAECPAPVATCTLPAAARPTDRIATYFHSSGVVTATANTDTECAAPIATCIRPAPQSLRLTDTSSQQPVDRPATLTELLHDWAAASSAHPAWTPSEQKWLARRHQPWLSAVALDAVIRLSSSVDASTLTRDFTWTQSETRDEVTVLHAVPKDETHRLFCPQLRVELDAVTHAMLAIDVADRAGTWRPIDLPWAVLPKVSRPGETIILTADRVEVELTDPAGEAATNGLPPQPTPASAVRFAADRIEFSISAPR